MQACVQRSTSNPEKLQVHENARNLRPRSGEPGAVRTHDPRLKRALLYQLSYGLVYSRCFKTTTDSPADFLAWGQGISSREFVFAPSHPVVNRNTPSLATLRENIYRRGNQDRTYDGTHGPCTSDSKRVTKVCIVQKMGQFRPFRWLESVSVVAVQVLLFSTLRGHYDYH